MMTFTFKYLDTYWSMTFTFKYNIPRYLLMTFTYSAYWCDFEFWRMSEWLLFNANSAISWREQVNFQWDDDEVCSVLDQQA